MSRKVFISFLGYNNYSQCHYTCDTYKSGTVRFIQEATLEYLTSLSEWTDTDVAYILLTEGAEKANWKDNGHRDRNTNEIIQCEGLQSRLQKMNTRFFVDTICNLPDGNNEAEIWTIFERVYEKLQDGDELYFDLTHGFRYLPMLVMVLINYSKFLKNTTVKSITYGNFESRNKSTNEAPIINMMPLSSLQDWTYAAGQFLDNGDVHGLATLCNNEIRPILKSSNGSDEGASALREFVKHLNSVIEERQSCRGMSIIRSENLSKLKKTTDRLDKTFITPLNPLFEKIKLSLADFDEKENILNGLAAATWCFQNNMIQQAATILQEFVITFFCKRHGFQIDDEENRNLISSAFTIKQKNIPMEHWSIKETDFEHMEGILKDELLNVKDVLNLYENLSTVRNDINHSGMRSKRPPMKSKSIKDNIWKCINGFKSILIEKGNE